MKKAILLIGLTFMLTSCAHTFMRGTVAMKMSDTEAHVCLGNNDVKVGDKVEFYKNICTRATDGREDQGDRECKMKMLGKGEVSKLLNSHYSLVTTDGKFKFSEGALVQKVK